MNQCLPTIVPSINWLTLLPAVIAAITTFALFILKDWLFVTRQRRIFARRLLSYSCGTLATALSAPPSSIEMKTTTLESYTDVMIGDAVLEAALTTYMTHFLRWRSGYFESIPEAQRRKAADELENIALSLR